MFPEILQNTLARYRAKSRTDWILGGVLMTILLVVFLVLLRPEMAIITWLLSLVWMVIVSMCESAQLWFEARRPMTLIENKIYHNGWWVGLLAIFLGSAGGWDTLILLGMAVIVIGHVFVPAIFYYRAKYLPDLW